MNDFREIESMTLYEYNIRMKAFRLQQVDRDYDIHRLAWESWNVQAMKRQGKNRKVPVFMEFKQFFDYEARLEEVTGGKKISRSTRISRAAAAMRKQNERRRRNGKL